MRPLVLYIATSADGFIARPDGDTQWLHHPDIMVEGEDFGYAEFYARIDGIIMGRKTLEVVDGFDMPFPYPDKENIAFSRHPQPAHPHVAWVQNDPLAYTEAMKNSEGKAIWLLGGAAIARQMHRAGLIDEVILTEVPVALEEGISLWENIPWQDRYQLENAREYPNGVRTTHWKLKK